jgi:aspartate racemase
MKLLGLIGGMSWESSAEYYRLINRGARDRVGPSASARILLWSFDFAEIEALQMAGEWAKSGELLIDAARRLEAAGCDALLICTNTMHKLFGEVEAAVAIPLLHIADPAAARANELGCTRVGLLGTAFTMEQPFYRERLAQTGLEVIVPGEAERAEGHRIIYDELIAGTIREQSRQTYRAIAEGLAAQGAEAIILGCTEIGLLLRDGDCSVPLLDTTALHAEAAVRFALSN